MNVANMSMYLDLILPDSKIFDDLLSLLQEHQQNSFFQVVVNGETIDVPTNVNMHIVNKAFYSIKIGLPFSEIRAKVAVGDIQNLGNNIFIAEYCFAEVFYHDGFIVTIDLFKSEVQRASKIIESLP